MLLFFIIAIIAFRDLIKQIYILHHCYNIKKSEEYIKTKYGEEFEVFNLRKSWLEKYYELMRITYFGFIAVFFLPLILFPIYLFLGCENYLGIILSVVMLLTLFYNC